MSPRAPRIRTICRKARRKRPLPAPQAARKTGKGALSRPRALRRRQPTRARPHRRLSPRRRLPTFERCRLRPPRASTFPRAAQCPLPSDSARLWLLCGSAKTLFRPRRGCELAKAPLSAPTPPCARNICACIRQSPRNRPRKCRASRAGSCARRASGARPGRGNLSSTRRAARETKAEPATNSQTPATALKRPRCGK